MTNTRTGRRRQEAAPEAPCANGHSIPGGDFKSASIRLLNGGDLSCTVCGTKLALCILDPSFLPLSAIANAQG